uniref:Zinc finger, CCHC-type n=1 Tax=Tanacetum cinerariifolium TaxID=118510 RepID=A0A6L2L6C2_TANCI|nr:zinc finger, CCHC-type [Tanacetum cinerariifolium]
MSKKEISPSNKSRLKITSSTFSLNLLNTVGEFHTSKQEEGQSVSSHVLKIKGYINNLERLGQPVAQNFAASLILVSLNKDFDSFMQNYNMHDMGKTVNEQHAMLKLHEEMLPKKDANHALHAMQAVRKNKKINRTNLLRGVMVKVKERWAMLLTMHHLLLNPRLLHHLRKITLQRTPFATNVVKLDTREGTGLRGSKKLKRGALSLYVGDGHRAAFKAIGTYHLELLSGLVIVLNNCHYAPDICERKPRKRQNQIKTGQKREVCQSREKFKAVAVDKERKTEENAKRMVENAYTVKKLLKL